MNILVIGMGSMGRRRTRIIQQIKNDHTIVGIDCAQSRRSQAEKELAILCYSDIDSAISANFNPDIAFICNPPLYHAETSLKMLHMGCHVFSEINLLSDGYSEIQNLAKDKNRVFFQSSTFNYRKDIQFIQKRLSQTKLSVAYTYHVGQYLPDWHPWESYKNFFVINKRTNGVRELLAIELPWIYKAFGDLISIYAKAGNITELELNYPDHYFVMLEHKNGHKGMLCFDIASRVPVRRFEAFNENLQILWEGTPESLQEYNKRHNAFVHVDAYTESIAHQQGYNKLIAENAYQVEIRCFFACIEKNERPLYNLKEDEKIIQWVNEIENQGAQ